MKLELNTESLLGGFILGLIFAGVALVSMGCTGIKI